jgi:hypothetical protein
MKKRKKIRKKRFKNKIKKIIKTKNKLENQTMTKYLFTKTLIPQLIVINPCINKEIRMLNSF